MNARIFVSIERARSTGILILRNLRIKQIPYILPDAITDLDCSGNELESLPELPKSLKRLICSGNRLTELPSLPSTLRVLDCSKNYLETMPPICHITTLDNLICNENLLRELPELPKQLKGLSCYANQLTYLPDLPDSLNLLWPQFNTRWNPVFMKIVENEDPIVAIKQYYISLRARKAGRNLRATKQLTKKLEADIIDSIASYFTNIRAPINTQQSCLKALVI